MIQVLLMCVVIRTVWLHAGLAAGWAAVGSRRWGGWGGGDMAAAGGLRVADGLNVVCAY